MNGRIVSRLPEEHRCVPGWTEGEPVKDRPGYVYHMPPEPRLFPKGTVWECGCGKTWVSTGPIASNSPGFIGFRPERRRERKRRVREALVNLPPGPGVSQDGPPP